MKNQNYMYILKCANGTLYVGSTKDLTRRLEEHQIGEGANHTKKHGPVELFYYEIFDRIDFAFEREQQVKKWSRVKKLALVENNYCDLKLFAKKKFGLYE